LLTLAVLAFSVMTGPASAQMRKIDVRPHRPVEHDFRMTPEHRRAVREQGRVLGLEDRDLDLRPSRPPATDEFSAASRLRETLRRSLERGGSKRSPSD
jgi:hypothetical protein